MSQITKLSYCESPSSKSCKKELLNSELRTLLSQYHQNKAKPPVDPGSWLALCEFFESVLSNTNKGQSAVLLEEFMQDEIALIQSHYPDSEFLLTVLGYIEKLTLETINKEIILCRSEYRQELELASVPPSTSPTYISEGNESALPPYIQKMIDKLGIARNLKHNLEEAVQTLLKEVNPIRLGKPNPHDHTQRFLRVNKLRIVFSFDSAEGVYVRDIGFRKDIFDRN